MVESDIVDLLNMFLSFCLWRVVCVCIPGIVSLISELIVCAHVHQQAFHSSNALFWVFLMNCHGLKDTSAPVNRHTSTPISRLRHGDRWVDIKVKPAHEVHSHLGLER